MYVCEVQGGLIRARASEIQQQHYLFITQFSKNGTFICVTYRPPQLKRMNGQLLSVLLQFLQFPIEILSHSDSLIDLFIYSFIYLVRTAEQHEQNADVHKIAGGKVESVLSPPPTLTPSSCKSSISVYTQWILDLFRL